MKIPKANEMAVITMRTNENNKVPRQVALSLSVATISTALSSFRDIASGKAASAPLAMEMVLLTLILSEFLEETPTSLRFLTLPQEGGVRPRHSPLLILQSSMTH